MGRSARSVSDFAFHDCAFRFGWERMVGIEAKSPQARYGRAAHRTFRAINDGLIAEKELDPEDITKVIDGDTEINIGQKGQLRDSALWFAAEVHSLKPIDAERLTPLEIGGEPWVFKPDAIRIFEDGTLCVDEYKTGYVPRASEAKTPVQLQVYALAAYRVFGIEKVRTVLWSVRNRIAIPVDWDKAELDNLEPFLASGARQIKVAYEAMDRFGRKALKTEIFTPTLNSFCRACPVRFKCSEHNAVLAWAQKPRVVVAGTSIETVQYLKKANTLIKATTEDHEEALRGEVMEAGGKYFEKGWVAWIETGIQSRKAQKATKRTVEYLKMGPVEGSSQTGSSGSKSSKPGRKKPRLAPASSSARSAGKSPTRSPGKRGGGSGKGGGSTSSTSKRRGHTRS